jgi:hypothetical protein
MIYASSATLLLLRSEWYSTNSQKSLWRVSRVIVKALQLLLEYSLTPIEPAYRKARVPQSASVVRGKAVKFDREQKRSLGLAAVDCQQNVSAASEGMPAVFHYELFLRGVSV